MTVLITRPKEDAKKIAKALSKVGIETIIAPMLNIHPLTLQGELFAAGGYVFTSTKGVKYAPKSLDKLLPVYAVGKKTADAARAKGFWCVAEAGGNIESLTRLLKAVWKPSHGDLLHFSGRHVRGDLRGSLKEAGISLYCVPVYEAKASKTLPDDIQKALKSNKITHALFYSCRTITTFQGVVKKEKLEDACKAIKVLCLSKAIKSAADDFVWGKVVVADDPLGEVMALLEKEQA
jgi:uroporphyrinogen-III synthase